LQNLLQVGAHQPPEFRQLYTTLFTAEQLATELGFESLDGAGEGRLGDMAALSRAMKIKCLRDRQEIPDLSHLHGVRLLMSWRHRGDH
jgi:hypothetical protein